MIYKKSTRRNFHPFQSLHKHERCQVISAVTISATYSPSATVSFGKKRTEHIQGGNCSKIYNFGKKKSGPWSSRLCSLTFILTGWMCLVCLFNGLLNKTTVTIVTFTSEVVLTLPLRYRKPICSAHLAASRRYFTWQTCLLINNFLFFSECFPSQLGNEDVFELLGSAVTKPCVWESKDCRKRKLQPGEIQAASLELYNCPGWTLGTTWDSERCPCHGNEIGFRVLSKPNHSRALQFHQIRQILFFCSSMRFSWSSSAFTQQHQNIYTAKSVWISSWGEEMEPSRVLNSPKKTFCGFFYLLFC